MIAGSARTHGGPLTRRWTEQRWLLDNTIRSVGMDWDQPRSLYLSTPCGPEASADFAAIRARITKLADASPAFEAVARRREARARAAEGERRGFPFPAASRCPRGFTCPRAIAAGASPPWSRCPAWTASRR
jgi:hypothetical protein